MKKLISASLFFLLVLVLPSRALAVEEFETKYQAFYQINEDGQSKISQQISLINKISQVYATKYSLILQSGSPKQVSASNDKGNLETKVFEQDGQTIIDIYFKDPVVGANKEQSFKVDYTIDDIAEKNGQVWEIKIPKIGNLNQIDSYLLLLSVPDSFGSKAFISPVPIEESKQEQQTVFRFTKDHLENGIVAVFGKMQIFDYLLTYHLENNSNNPVISQIALVPETPYQEIYYESLEPRPDNIEIDVDGNWLGFYRLEAREKKNINLKGKAKITAEKRPLFFWPKPVDLNNYLKEQKYWPVSDPAISTLAKNLKNAKDIYNFVVATLDYDLSQVNENARRKGALFALANPNQAICTEFTDLFITLARAKGIPAREINGYAYSNENKLKPLGIVADILHSWAEYWDQETEQWQPVDPTWGKTTEGINFFNRLDLNRLVLAIHGQNSQQPAPAGSYKTSSSNGKDVQITFGTFTDFPEAEINLEIILEPELFPEQQKQGKLIINNFSGVAYYPKSFTVNPPAVVEIEADKIIDSVIPPFSRQEFVFYLKPSKGLLPGTQELKFNLDDFEATANLKTGWQIGSLILPTAIFLILFLTGVLALIMIKKRKSL